MLHQPRTRPHQPRRRAVWPWIAAALMLQACATGPLSYRAEVSPVTYRAVKAATGAAAVLTLDRVGVSQPWATLVGVAAPVVVGKLARPQHRHPLGDWGCDLVWSSAVVPVLLAKPKVGRWNVSLGLGASAAWLGGAVAIAKECSP